MTKYLHILAAALFFVMAYIQLNDPDPIYWIVVYGISAFVAVANFMRKHFTMLTHVTYGMMLAGLLIALPGTIDYFTAGDFAAITGTMLAEKPYVESAREFGGLLIVAVYMVCVAATKYRR